VGFEPSCLKLWIEYVLKLFIVSYFPQYLNTWENINLGCLIRNIQIRVWAIRNMQKFCPLVCRNFRHNNTIYVYDSHPETIQMSPILQLTQLNLYVFERPLCARILLTFNHWQNCCNQTIITNQTCINNATVRKWFYCIHNVLSTVLTVEMEWK